MSGIKAASGSTTRASSGIPIVDLSRTREETEIVSELLEAFTTIGFCTLVHHGIPKDLFPKAFQASRNFFELPIEAKLKYKYKTPSSNRGYIPYGAECHDKDGEGNPLVTITTTTNGASTTAPDQKETMDIGHDDAEDVFKNEWPQELTPRDFRYVLETYFEEMDTLHLRLMKYIGRGLELPDDGDSLVRKCNGKHENLRLLHYPSMTRTIGGVEEDGTTRGNAHTDFGTLTLLVQDTVGGLKVKRKDGTWIDVQPVEDSIIVNVGDMLMRWSNDRLKATLHKVESPELTTNATTTYVISETTEASMEKTIVPERYSIAFFCNANKNVEIECLETCRSPAEPARYPPINAHEYLTQRLAATIQT
jgi:isopenicillin N synthase-like dioxygenase